MKRFGTSLTAVVFASALGWVFVPATVSAHGGGLDSHGCHNDRQAGDYHCHKGQHAGASFKSQSAMLATDTKNTKVQKEKAAADEKKAAAKEKKEKDKKK